MPVAFVVGPVVLMRVAKLIMNTANIYNTPIMLKQLFLECNAWESAVISEHKEADLVPSLLPPPDFIMQSSIVAFVWGLGSLDHEAR